jgi:aldehyde dehydrogenase (NAD+)
VIEDPAVPVISFTGSTETGSIIGATCGRMHKRQSLEMGGKNPMIVLADADLDLVVEGALWGAFGTSGQRCTASSRLLVHRKVVKKFTAMLAGRANALKVGSGLDEKVDMGPSINESQLDTVLDYIAIGKAEGAKCVAGGRRLAGKAHEKGWFVAPTVFGDCHRAMRVAREEIFGPVTSIVPIGSLEEGIDIANDSEYGLSSAIFTQDVNKAFVAMRDLEAGIFYVNLPTIGAETHLPFGGTKKTGNGHREAGLAALDVFSEWKSIYVDYSGTIQKAQIDVPAGEAAAKPKRKAKGRGVTRPAPSPSDKPGAPPPGSSRRL